MCTHAILRDLKAGEISDDEAWTALDPKSKLLVVVDVGSRTLAMAQRVVHQVTRELAPGCVPLFLTDGLKDDATAFLTHFGYWMQPERRQDKGPMPKSRWMPLPELLYAEDRGAERLNALRCRLTGAGEGLKTDVKDS